MTKLLNFIDNIQDICNTLQEEAKIKISWKKLKPNGNHQNLYLIIWNKERRFVEGRRHYNNDNKNRRRNHYFFNIKFKSIYWKIKKMLKYG
jgi:hypothetical protein